MRLFANILVLRYNKKNRRENMINFRALSHELVNKF